MVKPKYFLRETTPLIYYRLLKIVVTVGVIFGCITFAANLIAAFGGVADWITVAAQLLFLVLESLGLDGLYGWRWRGIRCLGLFSVLYLADQLALSYVQGDLDTYNAMVIICAWLTWMIPSYIYFKKRRPLFEPRTVETQEDQQKDVIKPVTLEYRPQFKLQGPPSMKQDAAAEIEQPHGKSYLGLCIVLGILLAASLTGNVVQMKNYRGLETSKNAEIASKDKEIEYLQINFKNASATIDDLKDKQELFIAERSRSFQMVILGSDKCYHRATCGNLSDKKGRLKSTIAVAIGNGYLPCPDCMIVEGMPDLAAYEYKSRLQRMINSGN